MIDSSIKFIVDAGVGRIIEEWLIQQGFNVISIITKNTEMPDSEVLGLAKIEDRLCKKYFRNICKTSKIIFLFIKMES